MSYVTRRRDITERAKAMTPDELAAVWSEDAELALDLAEVVNHLPTLERGLTSGVVALQLRVVASSSLPRLDPELLREALPDLPMDVRRKLFRRIRSKRLSALAEALLETVHTTQDVFEAGSLLPLCGSSTVERWLPVLAHAVNRIAIAKRHPELILARAFAELAELEAYDTWWRTYGYAIDQVVTHDPVRVLDLVEQFPPVDWLPFSGPSTTVLARTDPGRFIRLTEDRRCSLSKAAYLELAKANPPELVLLGRRTLPPVLKALPPSRRAEFFDAVHADLTMARFDVPEDVLRLLPRVRAAEEARRMLAIAREKADEPRIRRLTAFLPYDEGKDALIDVTRSGEADDRAIGYPLLIFCAARDFRLTELLPWLAERLKREQDPVRMAALQGLAQASPKALGDAPELAQVATDAFNARDFSPGTGQAVARVCEKLLVHHGSAMALRILADWWTREGWYSLGRFGQRLRRGQEHEVFAALRNTVTKEAEQVDFSPAFALTRTFGPRAWDMPELLELLWNAIPWDLEHASREAINLLLADPRHRNDRVARILELDPTAVFVPSVLNVLQYSRTDLLDVMLGSEIPEGTFAPKKVRLIPLGLDGTRFWTPAQRARYAELVMTLADSESHSRETRARAVRTLGTIHGPAKRNVLRYLDSADELIAQAALAVLPDADDPAEALDLLFQRALSDNRGQAELTSMYTIRRCARRVAPSALVPKLLAALEQGGRVTVRKELVRLASDFRVPGAVQILRSTWNMPNQHRDVRAAAAFAALSWLDDPEAWELLRAAVSGPREVSMQVLRVQPYSVAEQHRAGVGALIAGLATGPDDRLRDESLGALGAWTHWYPEAGAILIAAVTDLGERAGWESAAMSLTSHVHTGAGAEAVVTTLRTLLSRLGPDAEEDRDLPGLQRARRVVEWISEPWNMHPPRRELILRVADSLTQDEIRPDALRLRATTIRGRSAELIDDLLALEQLVSGMPQLAIALGQQILDLLWQWDKAMLTKAVLRLSDPYLLVTLLRAGHTVGWHDAWRARVRELRRHPDPGVRDAALAITTAVE
ncbi:hypothetical protein [Actinocrispum sp. NPDC049592]|uniref:hypothetical protein n=1 Tax=Actinocrispum sp. NPDC049592 TaxID=3154835 RepID=UPI00343C1852